MSLRTWLLLTLGLLGLLLAQAGSAQEGVRSTYDPNRLGPRLENSEPPLADGSQPAQPKTKEPKPLPSEIQAAPKSENGLIPAQAITSTPVSPRPVSYLATPVVTIDVVGNENAAEGSEVKYTFLIRNRSEAKAHHVLIRAIVPKNAKFINASLPAKEEKVGEVTELQWPIGTLNPGENRTIEIFFLPNPGETEMKVIGRVQIDHGRFLVTKISKPELKVKKTAPKEGVLHDAVNYRIEVLNAGKTTLTDVRIEDQLGKDDGMEYERDPNAKIDYEKNQRTWTIPSLTPGERRVFDFTVFAKKTGQKKTITRVSASGVSPVVESHEINILEARLNMKVTPPTQATVGQPAEVKILIENKGTATLNNVRVNVGHPQDVDVVKARQGAQFFKDGVQWILPKLAAGENRELSVLFTTKLPGTRKLAVSTKADRGQEQQDNTLLEFEGIPALNWKTERTPTSTEGRSVNYTVEVYNPGTANATNVVLRVKLPPEVRLENAYPLHLDPSDGVFTFRPVHIPPKTKVTFSINGLAQKKGAATAHFDLIADHTKTSLHNEVTTTINPGDKPKQLDRTTQGPKEPKGLPFKEATESKPKDNSVLPVARERDTQPDPKKEATPQNEAPKQVPLQEPPKEPPPAPKKGNEPEPLPELKKLSAPAPKKGNEPEAIPPLGPITPPSLMDEKKEAPKKDEKKDAPKKDEKQDTVPSINVLDPLKP